MRVTTRLARESTGWSAARTIVYAVAAMTLTMSGCATRQDDAASPGASGVGIGEEGLAGSSSIEQWEETGTVAAGGVFRDVRFGFDSDGLSPGAREAISHNATILRADDGRRVEIEGHCDDRGSSEYNLALGARRARSVRDALIAEGIGSDRLTTVSYGEELPLCKDANEQCWSINRRAHLVDLDR